MLHVKNGYNREPWSTSLEVSYDTVVVASCKPSAFLPTLIVATFFLQTSHQYHAKIGGRIGVIIANYLAALLQNQQCEQAGMQAWKLLPNLKKNLAP